MNFIKKPCPSCPWRPEAHMRDIPGFDLDLSRGLRRLWRVAGADAVQMIRGRFAMACHGTCGDEKLCAGYAIAQQRAGIPNVALRIALVAGWIDGLPEDDGTPLHADLDEVVAKHERQAAGRAPSGCYTEARRKEALRWLDHAPEAWFEHPGHHHEKEP